MDDSDDSRHAPMRLAGEVIQSNQARSSLEQLRLVERCQGSELILHSGVTIHGRVNRIHLLATFEMEPQRDGTIFSIVTPSDLNVLLFHPSVLRTESHNVCDKRPFVIANNFDIQITRIFLDVFEGARTINIWHITA